MNEIILSEQFIPFPPCATMQQVEAMEHIIFGLVPSVTGFTREVTPAERKEGIINPHAYVTKNAGGTITRSYGAMIAYLGDLQ
jgi:hypothetical protein